MENMKALNDSELEMVVGGSASFSYAYYATYKDASSNQGVQVFTGYRNYSETETQGKADAQSWCASNGYSFVSGYVDWA